MPNAMSLAKGKKTRGVGYMKGGGRTLLVNAMATEYYVVEE